MDDQVFDLMGSMEAVREILTKLTTSIRKACKNSRHDGGQSGEDYCNGFSGGHGGKFPAPLDDCCRSQHEAARAILAPVVRVQQ